MKPLLVALVALATALPLCAQSAARDRLENSPRHHEWVAIEHGGRTLHAFVVYPEVKHQALAVLVLHENRGLTDWVRAAADRLAEEGYIAIAPDLLSGSGPAGGRTKDFPTTDAAREAIGQLDPAAVLADLRATAAHARTIPAATGEVAVVGFCWGGSQTWRLALTGEELVVAALSMAPRPSKLISARSRHPCTDSTAGTTRA